MQWITRRTAAVEVTEISSLKTLLYEARVTLGQALPDRVGTTNYVPPQRNSELSPRLSGRANRKVAPVYAGDVYSAHSQ